MRAARGLTVTLALGMLAAAACEAPDPARDGFVLVDEEARAAGIAVEVAGELHDGVAPVTVPEGAPAALRGPDGIAPLVVEPGELIEVRGPDGEVVRSLAPRDAVAVRGDEAATRLMAEMMGAEVRRGPTGELVLEGPNAFVLAAVLGAQPGIQGFGAPAATRAATRDALDVGFLMEAPRQATIETPADAEGAAAFTPDPAALVGLYHHGEVGLLLDASGGYAVMRGGEVVVRGTFSVCPGGVDFAPDGGGPIARMRLTGETLVDSVGVEFDTHSMDQETER